MSEGFPAWGPKVPAPGLGWLIGPERRIGPRAYARWKMRLDAADPTASEVNHRKAMNAAYGTLACLWMPAWGFLILAAAFSFEINQPMVIFFSACALPPIAICFVRAFQAVRAYSKPWALPRERGGSVHG